MYQSAHGLQHAFDSRHHSPRHQARQHPVDRTGTAKISTGPGSAFHDEDDLLTKQYDETVRHG